MKNVTDPVQEFWEKKALEQERKEMYEKQKLDRKEERAKYREKANDNHLSIED